MTHVLPLIIRATSDPADLAICADLMASSEPWRTLGRDAPFVLAGMRRPGREVFVAEAADQLAGCAVITLQGAFIGYLQSLCISATVRGRGVGSALLTHVEHYIFRTAPNVFLCVSDFNAGAIRFYERQGYEIVGKLENYVVSGHSEILMRKTTGPIDTFTPS